MPNSFEVYIHSPWCKRRCPYCDFTVYIDRNPQFKIWKDQVLANWEWNKEHFNYDVNTIYFGGGTPSLIPLQYLEEIIRTIEPSPKECTLEINPGTITPEQLKGYLDIGINRVSIGVQSFQAKFEKLLGRGGTVAQARELVQTVQKLPFQSWSMDLMFGLPMQTLAELERDLEEIIEIRPPHISIYGLMYKPNTPFYQARKTGKLKPIDDEVWIQMFELIGQKLKEQGYHRYEVSNFCLPEHSAQHNEAVWMGKHYAGLGPSAHGFLPDGTRTIYSSDWHKWLQDSAPILEKSTNEQLVIDLLLTKIRHYNGFSHQEIKKRGFELDPNTIEYLARTNAIYHENGMIRLKSKGWSIVDYITNRLIQGLQNINY